MFYGSDDIATVLAEISAHSAKSFAVVGEFETRKPLTMVDLASLPAPNLFDPGRRADYYELRFMHAFARDLSASVVLDGREHIEYVPTQVVTEYLRWLPEFHVDGILFASAQNGGTSCVIFCGPDECSEPADDADTTVVRLVEGSVRAVQVMATPRPARSWIV